MEHIQFDNVRLSKIKPFAVNKGKYCFINYNNNNDNSKLIINTMGIIAFDVNFNYPRPNVFINMESNLTTFTDNLKTVLVKNVHSNVKEIFGSYKTIESLSDFYCNPCKIIEVNKTFTDLLKLKLNCEYSGELLKGCIVNLTIHVSGMWFSDTSYGPYFNINEISLIELPEKEISMFLENDDDSDDEIKSYVKVI